MKSIYNKLFDYQKEIHNKFKYYKSFALFMDMGTGKTITSLSLTRNKKILVVCLATKIKDWETDINEHFPIYDVIRLDKGTKRNKKLLEQDHDALIISFESSWRLTELLDVINDDYYIIIDESHKIKNRKSKLGKFVRKLKNTTEYKMILTGTPQHKKYMDYYNQLYFIDALNMSWRDFENKFCITMRMDYGGFPVKEIVGYKNTGYLDNIIKDVSAFYRRNYDDYDAPRDIVLNVPRHREYKKLEKNRFYNDILCDTPATLRLRLKQLCSGFIGDEIIHENKIKILKDFLDTYPERVVIFYNFNVERDMVKALLESMGRPYSEYHGEIKNLEKFKENENGVVLCNYKTGSTGINDLVISNMTIYYSLTDYYIEFAQSKKRTDRIGQTKQPVYYYLITEKSVEVAIKKSLDSGKDFDNKQFENLI